MVKRYALVGVGSRGYSMFMEPLLRDYADVAQLVGLCDTNPARMRLANARCGSAIPCYADVEALVAAQQPDVVIVASVDATHAEITCMALELGCDVIAEKPMATTAEQVRDILDAERRSGQSLRVSFNARYGAPTERLKELLNERRVGRIASVDFTEFLDTRHGADYFRRWHRNKANSGGLLVHKATHHFDQINWWIDSDPETVFAMGARQFYGPQRDERGERCLTCGYADSCPFYVDLRSDEALSALYLRAESEDGYWRDRCVFAPEIDIEDTLHVTVRYANGVLLNYALYAFAPFEGQRIGFTGSAGRMEVDWVDRYHGLDVAGGCSVRPLDVSPDVRTSPHFGRAYIEPVVQRTGAHGGADARIRKHLFRKGVPDPLRQQAGSRAGAMSVLVGCAANQALVTGHPVRISDLIKPEQTTRENEQA